MVSSKPTSRPRKKQPRKSKPVALPPGTKTKESSCATCRLRKVKCSGGRPACALCIKGAVAQDLPASGVRCLYSAASIHATAEDMLLEAKLGGRGSKCVWSEPANSEAAPDQADEAEDGSDGDPGSALSDGQSIQDVAEAEDEPTCESPRSQHPTPSPLSLPSSSPASSTAFTLPTPIGLAHHVYHPPTPPLPSFPSFLASAFSMQRFEGGHAVPPPTRSPTTVGRNAEATRPYPAHAAHQVGHPLARSAPSIEAQAPLFHAPNAAHLGPYSLYRPAPVPAYQQARAPEPASDLYPPFPFPGPSSSSRLLPALPPPQPYQPYHEHPLADLETHFSSDRPPPARATYSTPALHLDTSFAPSLDAYSQQSTSSSGSGGLAPASYIASTPLEPLHEHQHAQTHAFGEAPACDSPVFFSMFRNDPWAEPQYAVEKSGWSM